MFVHRNAGKEFCNLAVFIIRQRASGLIEVLSHSGRNIEFARRFQFALAGQWRPSGQRSGASLNVYNLGTLPGDEVGHFADLD